MDQAQQEGCSWVPSHLRYYHLPPLEVSSWTVVCSGCTSLLTGPSWGVPAPPRSCLETGISAGRKGVREGEEEGGSRGGGEGRREGEGKDGGEMECGVRGSKEGGRSGFFGGKIFRGSKP